MAQGHGPVLNYVRPYYIPGKDWSAATNTLSIARGVSSATALLGRVYLSTDYNVKGKKFLSKAQSLAGLSFAQVQCNGKYHPHKEIQSIERMYASTQKCMGIYLDGDASSLITRAKYTGADAESTFAAVPTGYFAFDFRKNGI